jgi:site-specific DNA recombinase
MPDLDLRVGIYARVSGEQQAKEDTIASQLEEVNRRVAADGFQCDPESCFVDDGISGDYLLRPGLERLRDQAAAGALDRLYVLDPDRFSRKYAYQVLVLEELAQCSVEVIFLHNPPGQGPEQNLLVQVQGMIAEYERAKILERCRRGKQYAARCGSVNVLSGAPYGYRYIDRHEGDGAARYQVLAEEARIVRKIFEWVGQERCSIGEVCRRLQREGIPTRTGKSAWDRSVVWAILRNPAYKGTAAFGKTRSGSLKSQRLRPQRGRPAQPRRPVTRVEAPAEDRTFIPVPGLVSDELFEAVQVQLEENRQRRRDRPQSGPYLLQGLLVCKRCGYGCYGKPVSRASAKGKVRYAYYRCTGSDGYRFGGQRLCWNKQVRTDLLDTAVWEDVRQLLSEPERVRAEYERRLQASGSDTDQDLEHINKMIANLKRMISRLIDAYSDGLLERTEFEPRVSAARGRLAKMEADRRERVEEAAQESELRLVIGQLEEFATRVSQELQQPDWETRRAIVRALVRQVEVDDQEVRIVYRVSPSPFDRGPQHGDLQRCWGRVHPDVREHRQAGPHP